MTLGGSLTSSGTKVGNALHNPVGTGLIGISLPFLNWNTVKWNVKISEADYETARLNYEQSITKALNDVDTNYFAYTQAQSAFANLQKHTAITNASPNTIVIVTMLVYLNYVNGSLRQTQRKALNFLS